MGYKFSQYCIVYSCDVKLCKTLPYGAAVILQSFVAPNSLISKAIYIA